MMLQIRQEQIELFDRISCDRYLSDLKAYLAREHGDKLGQKSDPELHDFVEQGINKAHSYGITSQADVSAFVERLVTYGPNMDADPEYDWLRKILTDPNTPGQHKMDAIEQVELAAMVNGPEDSDSTNKGT